MTTGSLRPSRGLHQRNGGVWQRRSEPSSRPMLVVSFPLGSNGRGSARPATSSSVGQQALLRLQHEPVDGKATLVQRPLTPKMAPRSQDRREQKSTRHQNQSLEMARKIWLRLRKTTRAVQRALALRCNKTADLHLHQEKKNRRLRLLRRLSRRPRPTPDPRCGRKAWPGFDGSPAPATAAPGPCSASCAGTRATTARWSRPCCSRPSATGRATRRRG